MSPLLIANIQFLLGLIIYTIAYRKYLRPRLREVGFHEAVAPMMLLHGFRFLGLTLLAPGQVGPGHDMGALSTIAFGDLAAGVTGVIAAFAAYQRLALARPLAWVFTVVGLGDFILVGFTAASAGVFDHSIGGMWFLQGLYAPLLLMSHVIVISTLLAPRPETVRSDLNERARTSIAHLGRATGVLSHSGPSESQP